MLLVRCRKRRRRSRQGIRTRLGPGLAGQVRIGGRDKGDIEPLRKSGLVVSGAIEDCEDPRSTPGRESAFGEGKQSLEARHFERADAAADEGSGP